MFDKLFAYIRNGVRDAILGGFQDAHDELAKLTETGDPITLEDHSDRPLNGKTNNRRKTTSR
ncbi:MAG: hypothetical protein KDA84_07550 [Planctomycetaceae bacterium]|nr:hypothetical protein [Planctomycetaceae bacterium]